MRVFLVRHAHAAAGDPDRLRVLSEAGAAAARTLGARLAREHPDAVLSSPLLRARQTAQAIADAAGVAPRIDERLAPGTTPELLRNATHGQGATVVAVGHQPDCSEIVLALTGRRVSFPPAHCEELEL